MRTTALALALLLLAAGQVRAADSPAGAAATLPLDIPAFQPAPAAPVYREFQPEEVVRDTTCAVSADQLPPDFLKLMGRLSEPVATTDTGLPPVVSEVVPALRNTPAQQERRRSSHGVEIITGKGDARLGRSRENGVTVYRGVEAERR